jgi:branched-chain amino acid transport system substrate-binding protein
VFQWAFNMPGGYFDAASMILTELGEGDQANLADKKIAFLHLDHPFGKEPLPYLQAKAELHGFELLPIPVGLNEMQNQSAQWLQIRRERPDFVVMWGWGAMNAGAITEAVKTRYPMDQFVGVWWAGHSDDLQLVGEAGAGYRSISWSKPNDEAPAMQAVRDLVIDAGDSMASEEEISEVFYQRGIVMSAILAEGIRNAQAEYGVAEIDGPQLRWGLENINLTEERLEELGIAGMVPPFSTSCDNHTGHAGGWMLEWNGAEFVQASDHLMPDLETIRPLVEANAAAYAETNAPWPTNDSCNADS